MNLQKGVKLRAEGTGSWFLDGNIFKDWRTDSASVIWLYGSAGSGKTVLSASVINQLQQDFGEDSTASLAYFFFDFNEQTKQEPGAMMRALLSQLLNKCPYTPGRLLRLISGSATNGKSASQEELLGAFDEIVSVLQETYIVLDALDECRALSVLLETLEHTVCLSRPNVHIIMTSRKEIEIEEGLDFIPDSKKVCLESRVVDEDIRKYVRERLQSDKGLQRWQKDQATQHEIESALTSQANGM